MGWTSQPACAWGDCQGTLTGVSVQRPSGIWRRFRVGAWGAPGGSALLGSPSGAVINDNKIVKFCFVSLSGFEVVSNRANGRLPPLSGFAIPFVARLVPSFLPSDASIPRTLSSRFHPADSLQPLPSRGLSPAASISRLSSCHQQASLQPTSSKRPLPLQVRLFSAVAGSQPRGPGRKPMASRTRSRVASATSAARSWP